MKNFLKKTVILLISAALFCALLAVSGLADNDAAGGRGDIEADSVELTLVHRYFHTTGMVAETRTEDGEFTEILVVERGAAIELSELLRPTFGGFLHQPDLDRMSAMPATADGGMTIDIYYIRDVAYIKDTLPPLPDEPDPVPAKTPTLSQPVYAVSDTEVEIMDEEVALAEAPETADVSRGDVYRIVFIGSALGLAYLGFDAIIRMFKKSK